MSGPTPRQPGAHWQPLGRPARYPHTHVRHGTAKLLTLFHPATGQVRVKGVPSCTNTVLHDWLEQELSAVLALLPLVSILPDADSRRISDRETLVAETTAWMHQRNVAQTTIDWRFTTADARIKLKRLYPAVLP